MTSHITTLADSRDMIGAHDMFRLHFGALPRLVRDVPVGDVTRAAVVAEHLALLATLLHGHHSAEDEHVWPRLHERCPQQVQALVGTMQAQHEQIDFALHDLTAGATRWAATADAEDRDAVAQTADRLNPALREHLALEEAEVLRLIDTHLSEQEWKASVAASAARLSPEQGALAVGMLLDRADTQMQEILRAGAPADFWEQARTASLAAYDDYAKHVYGDTRP